MVYSTTKGTKCAKESENKTLDAIFQSVVKVDKWPDLRPRQFQVVHAIGKVGEFQLRALRGLRGDFLPLSADERSG